MPKEYVNGEAVPYELGSPETPVAAVRWGRETGHVQLVTRLRECELFFDPDDPTAPIPCQYGYYVTLDRRGINDLIRTLRKARDQAFGRDE